MHTIELGRYSGKTRGKIKATDGACARPACLVTGAAAGWFDARVTSSDIAVNKCRQLGFGHGADLGGFDIAVLEQHQGRDAADAVFGRCRLIVVDVEFGDLEPACVFPGDIVEDGRDHLARPAPLGPIVDQHRHARLQYFRLEWFVGSLMNVLPSWTSPADLILGIWARNGGAP